MNKKMAGKIRPEKKIGKTAVKNRRERDIRKKQPRKTDRKDTSGKKRLGKPAGKKQHSRDDD